jgi:hypothetical protein
MHVLLLGQLQTPELCEPLSRERLGFGSFKLPQTIYLNNIPLLQNI